MATESQNPKDSPENEKRDDSAQSTRSGQSAARRNFSTTSSTMNTPSPATRLTEENMRAAQEALGEQRHAPAEPPEAVVKAIDDFSDRAVDAVSRASEGLKQTSANAAQSVQQAQDAVRARAYEVKANAAQQLHKAAETLRTEVRTGEGQPVDQAGMVAARLDNLGNYLEQHSFEEIEGDVRQTIQRNPWQSVAVGVAVGWVLSRIFGRRR
jgi:ElaB/YqjD/DUF883 family membrane-anchored ribosome-binding protein